MAEERGEGRTGENKVREYNKEKSKRVKLESIPEERNNERRAKRRTEQSTCDALLCRKSK